MPDDNNNYLEESQLIELIFIIYPPSRDIIYLYVFYRYHKYLRRMLIERLSMNTGFITFESWDDVIRDRNKKNSQVDFVNSIQ